MMQSDREVNQSLDVYNYLKAHPGSSAADIEEGTQWIGHVVNMVLKLLEEQGLIHQVGVDDKWGDITYELVG